MKIIVNQTNLELVQGDITEQAVDATFGKIPTEIFDFFVEFCIGKY